MTQRKASEELKLSIRQIKRLCKKVREEGLQGLAHKNRGQPSNRKITNDKIIEVLDLIRIHYSDFGATLLQEMLEEKHNLKYSSEWIRKVMISNSLRKAKKKKEHKLYQRRNRRAREGELVQIDGSYHKWFEDRGPKCCLLVMIDDATGKLQELRFVEHETVEDYFKAIKQYIKKHGLPLALYSDRHSIFKTTRNNGENIFKDTQFKRGVKDLGIDLICANTPQAKGRVERANGILQDRLIKMMRLDDISNIEEGNKYLEEYKEKHNKRFAKEPLSTENAHRTVPEYVDLDKVLCRQETRKMSKQLEVSYEGTVYQIIALNNTRRMINRRITIYDSEEGLVFEFEGKEYDYKVYNERSYAKDIMSRKHLDAFLDGKKPMSNIERIRKKIATPY